MYMMKQSNNKIKPNMQNSIKVKGKNPICPLTPTAVLPTSYCRSLL